MVNTKCVYLLMYLLLFQEARWKILTDDGRWAERADKGLAPETTTVIPRVETLPSNTVTMEAPGQQGVINSTGTTDGPNIETNSTDSDTTPTQGDVPTMSTRPQFIDTTNLGDVNNTSNDDFPLKPNPFVGGLVDKSKYEHIILILSYIGSCTSILGTFGNALALVVHSRMPKSSTRAYLIGVTVLDSLYLLSTITPFTMTIILEGRALDNRFYLYYAAYGNTIIIPCLRKTIICVTMMLSLERLLAIAFPIRARHFRIIKQPTTFIVLTFVFVVSLQSYNFNKHHIIDSVDPTTNQTVPTLVRGEFYNKNKNILSTFDIISTGLTVYTPLLVIAIANTCLVLVLQRCICTLDSRSHDVHSQFFRLEFQKSVTILTYTCLFLLFSLPYVLHVILSRVVGVFNPGQQQHYLYLTMVRVYGILDAASSSMNLLVYVSISKSFRLQLKIVLGLRHVTSAPMVSRNCGSSTTVDSHI